MTRELFSAFQTMGRQLYNPTFLASMGSGDELHWGETGNNVLGDYLVGVDDVLQPPVPEHEAEDFIAKVSFLNRFSRDAGDRYFFANATGLKPDQLLAEAIKSPEDITRMQKLVAAAAPEHLDPRLYRLATKISEKRAGIPVGRPVANSFEAPLLVHLGFKPSVLHRLVSKGAISRSATTELGAALLLNLRENIGMLGKVLEENVYPRSHLIPVSQIGFFVACAGLLCAGEPLAGTISLFGGSILTAGRFFASREARPFSRAFGLSAFSTNAKVLELMAAQEDLLVDYITAFGRYLTTKGPEIEFAPTATGPGIKVH